VLPVTIKKMQIRLWSVFMIAMFFTFGTFYIYLQISGEDIATFRRLQFIFFIPIISAVISLAPIVMKTPWKKIIIQTGLSTIFGTVIFLVIFRLF
jgi:hypothetical protein